MMIDFIIFSVLTVINAELLNSIEANQDSASSETILVPTRRIINGNEAGLTRPYMVYLRPSPNADRKITDSNWLCGGVIIDKRYILTSAACIEDSKHFVVVSGTHTWVPPSDSNECINNGAKRAVWKCVPKSYIFDGDNFDNIRWMVGDIAIIKVEDDFNFSKKIRGCDFIPKKIAFNNISQELEKGGTQASVAGWGTTDKYYVDKDYRAPLREAVNSLELLESDVLIISKKSCMNRWEERYRFIINDEMVCTKDSFESDHLSTVCMDSEVACKGMDDKIDDDYNNGNEHADLRMIIDPITMKVHTAAHQDQNTRRFIKTGGFCENDHGGPLVVGYGKSAVVIGIMSACLTKSVTKKCYGPYLFTSVYKYRGLISCAIERSNDPSCAMLLRTHHQPALETPITWTKKTPRKTTKWTNLTTTTKKPKNTYQTIYNMEWPTEQPNTTFNYNEEKVLSNKQQLTAQNDFISGHKIKNTSSPHYIQDVLSNFNRNRDKVMAHPENTKGNVDQRVSKMSLKKQEPNYSLYLGRQKQNINKSQTTVHTPQSMRGKNKLKQTSQRDHKDSKNGRQPGNNFKMSVPRRAFQEISTTNTTDQLFPSIKELIMRKFFNK